jgi:hypothetical protein
MPCSRNQCCRKEDQPLLPQFAADRDPKWPLGVFLVLVILFCLIAFSYFVTHAHGQEPAAISVQSIDYTKVEIPTLPKNPIPISIYRLHDADTITDCTIHLPFDVDLPHCSIRCFGFDAWEVNRQRDSDITQEEINLGLKAKDELVSLLLLPSRSMYAENRLYVEDVGIRDPYGRRLCWWWIKTQTKDETFWLNVAAWGRQSGYQRIERLTFKPEPNFDLPPRPLPQAPGVK